MFSFAWEIESFDADLAVQADGSVQVTEAIRANFQGEARHGIYRDIPLVTQDRLGVRRSIRLIFLEATDENGRSWDAEVSREGVYRRIRLGSKYRTTTGRKLFKISYRVERILQSFPDHDEFYWNVTGNNWAVPLRRVSAVVRLPGAVPDGRLRSSATTGAYGATGHDVSMAVESAAAVRYTVTRPLSPFDGLTLVAGWPSGLVQMPGRWQKVRWFLQDNWGFEIPFLVLALMLGVWWKFGRDPPRGNITVQYEPPDGLAPAEIGTLMDDRVDAKDITATIVDLARCGYLSIEELPDKDYRLIRRPNPAGDPGGDLRPYEALLLGDLFAEGSTVQLSDLENQFYQQLPAVRTALYDGLVKKGYWWSRPDRVRKFWFLIAGIVFFVGCLMLQWQDPVALWVFWVSAGIIAYFARFMPRKTARGAKTMEGILGFEEFLRRTDEDRIKRESNPAVLFERMLPYALAFGVANQWAKAFEGLARVNPSWYSGGGTFTPSDFSRRINQAGSRMGAVLTSVPRSSGGSGFGGGFSGGGGGGGGGGSW